LRKIVSEIVPEQFKRKSLEKLKNDDRDLLLSEIYAFLTDQIKKSLKTSVIQKKNELCLDLVETKEQKEVLKNEQILALTNETKSIQTDRLIKE